MDELVLELRGVGRLLHAGLIEQLLVHPVPPEVGPQWHRDAIDLLIVNGGFPRSGGNRGQIGIVLDRVAAEIGRQIGDFGIEELGHDGDARIGDDEEQVRELATGHGHLEFGAEVVGERRDIHLQVGADLSIDLLPARILVERVGDGGQHIGHDVDLAAVAWRCLDCFHAVRGIPFEALIDHPVG